MSDNTYASLLAQKAELEKKIEVARRRETTAVIKRIREAIEIYDLKPEELFEKLEHRRYAKPVKYADDKGNTWAGGGRTPNWLKAYVDQGHSIEEFRVNQQAA